MLVVTRQLDVPGLAGDDEGMPLPTLSGGRFLAVEGTVPVSSILVAVVGFDVVAVVVASVGAVPTTRGGGSVVADAAAGPAHVQLAQLPSTQYVSGTTPMDSTGLLWHDTLGSQC